MLPSSDCHPGIFAKRNIRDPASDCQMPQPRWLDFAWGDFGVAEIAGSRDNTRVVRYYADVGHPQVDNDEVAWCAAFLGSYRNWGEATGDRCCGAIAVLS